MMLPHQPADKLFVNFVGTGLRYVEQSTGEAVHCQVFAACLPYSDYSFVFALPGQKPEDFLYALRKCLEHLGGVPAALAPDTLHQQ